MDGIYLIYLIHQVIQLRAKNEPTSDEKQSQESKRKEAMCKLASVRSIASQFVATVCLQWLHRRIWLWWTASVIDHTHTMSGM